MLAIGPLSDRSGRVFVGEEEDACLDGKKLAIGPLSDSSGRRLCVGGGGGGGGGGGVSQNGVA
jgi:hypothetical protein